MDTKETTEQPSDWMDVETGRALLGETLGAIALWRKTRSSDPVASSKSLVFELAPAAGHKLVTLLTDFLFSEHALPFDLRCAALKHIKKTAGMMVEKADLSLGSSKSFSYDSLEKQIFREVNAAIQSHHYLFVAITEQINAGRSGVFAHNKPEDEAQRKFLEQSEAVKTHSKPKI